jgi:hypothetical protein
MSTWRPYEPCKENEFRAIEHRDPQRWIVIKWAAMYLPFMLPLSFLQAAGAIADQIEQRELAGLHGDWRP